MCLEATKGVVERIHREIHVLGMRNVRLGATGRSPLNVYYSSWWPQPQSEVPNPAPSAWWLPVFAGMSSIG
ncbi:MAG: hypothetical protein ABI137_06520, partial [Antricoccus sp.]